MRLSDVLSKPPVSRFEQVDNFLGKTKLNCGKQRKVNVGIVGLTYFCKHCDDFDGVCPPSAALHMRNVASFIEL